jgi:hypothetical protein
MRLVHGDGLLAVAGLDHFDSGELALDEAGERTRLAPRSAGSDAHRSRDDRHAIGPVPTFDRDGERPRHVAVDEQRQRVATEIDRQRLVAAERGGELRRAFEIRHHATRRVAPSEPRSQHQAIAVRLRCEHRPARHREAVTCEHDALPRRSRRTAIACGRGRCGQVESRSSARMARRRTSACECSCETRDSLSPSVSATSRMVRSLL